VIVAIAVSLLYPLDLCYEYDDKPDVGDIIQAFIDIDADSVPSGPDDDCSQWFAGLPHGNPPAIPDVEKILPAFWPNWVVVSGPVQVVESHCSQTSNQQQFLHPFWSRPPPNA